jgi:hypothetical protein
MKPVASREHDQSLRAIAAHFAGRATPTAETAMRGHLPHCAACRRRYARELMFAQLDPGAPSAELRIARGLGFRMRAQPRPERWVARFSIPVAIAAVLAVWSSGHEHSRGFDATSGFAARSAERHAARAPAFWAYRIPGAGAPRLVDRTIGARDELAFAYSNPGGKPYVMIFGVDEHRHGYWFHPGWLTGQPPPAAIRAAAGPGPHELPGAIQHAIDGRRLNVYALFCDQPITAAIVEQRLHDAQRWDDLPPFGEGTVAVRRAFEVLP